MCNGLKARRVNRQSMKHYVVCDNGGQGAVAISQSYATGVRLKLYLFLSIAPVPSARGCHDSVSMRGQKNH